MQRFYTIITLFLVIILFACNKKEDVTIAGKTGNAVFHVRPSRANDTLTNVRVYVKYNMTETPANGKYDDSVMCNMVDGKWLGTFNNLARGNYFIYGIAYDNVLKDEAFKSTSVFIDDDSKIYDVPLSLGR